MITNEDFEQLCKDLDLEIPTIFYDSQNKPYSLDDDGNPEYFTPSAASIKKDDIYEEKHLTDEQRLCYHRFEFVGRSPVLDEAWWNCKECGIAREEYEKHKIKEKSKYGGDWF